MAESRIRVEQAKVSHTVRVFDIDIGQGAVLVDPHDVRNGLFIRIGFNHHVTRDEGIGTTGSMYPFLSTHTAQIVYLHQDTEVTPKNIKVVVE